MQVHLKMEVISMHSFNLGTSWRWLVHPYALATLTQQKAHWKLSKRRLDGLQDCYVCSKENNFLPILGVIPQYLGLSHPGNSLDTSQWTTPGPYICLGEGRGKEWERERIFATCTGWVTRSHAYVSWHHNSHNNSTTPELQKN